jgi:hypothetical protein
MPKGEDFSLQGCARPEQPGHCDRALGTVASS